MTRTTTPADEPLARLLRRLGDTPDAAGEAYESLRRLLCRYFEVRGCRDASTLSDEVLDRMSRRLVDGVEIADVGAYARGIARLVLLEARRRPVDGPLDGEPPARVDSDEAEREETSICLERCLGRLGAAARAQVLDYYTADGRGRIDGRKRLALQLGLSATALRLRMLRVRLSLERCVNGCTGRDASRNTSGQGGTDR
jgi:DNA-directed RNA polymerase specialized sigma24 family protein